MKTDHASKFIQAYVNFLLENGHEPASIHQFCVSLKKKEADFYSYFSSFDGLKAAWALKEFTEVRERIQGDETYDAYSAREKYMAFLYAWTEHAMASRSFWLLMMPNGKASIKPPAFLHSLKSAFKDFAQGICREGVDRNEVIQRPFISDRYPDAMWLQFMFVHQFWLKDDSAGFDKTDAAIEKSVHLTFDLMGNNAFDSALDFGKFMFGQFR